MSTPRTFDAVVVVPGILGSELVDSGGHVVWGLDPVGLAKAWVTGNLTALHPTDQELAGTPRLRPSRLLRVPSYMPMLCGLEPYTRLLNRAAQVTDDERAVLEFPYDWRLSIAYNAAKLVDAAEQHRERWQAIVKAEHPGQDPEAVRLVVVAHSMGGLVTRYAAEVLGLAGILREVVTAGTPFFGSINAVQMLATGEGAPMPRRAARALARLCPGVYDLLPRYRCVTEDGALRALSVADVSDLEGLPELATQASQRWEQLNLRDSLGGSLSWTAIVGGDQPTWQSVNLATREFERSLGGVDYAGDSTVYRGSAAPIGVSAIAIPQKHSALLKAPEAITMVADLLLGDVSGPPLGTRRIGADIPDVVPAGARPVVAVTDPDGGADPVGISVTSTDLESGRPTTWPSGTKQDETVVFTGPLLAAGLHRVEVKAGGFSPVSDILLVAEDT